VRVFEMMREQGVRWITWTETFGDCVMYAAAIRRQTNCLPFPVVKWAP
jgi:hypothetical protein